jgi:hypothetical protein
MVVTSIQVTADTTSQQDSSCPNWTRRDRFLLDGLRYDVYVAAHNGGYWGVWACLECGDHGASLLNDSTPDAASTRAQLGLNEHHNRFHRNPRKPK